MKSPSETSPGTAAAFILPCAACHAANRVDRQFCAACGARLWEPCLQCETINAVCEKHCGSCGANLAELVREAQIKIEAGLHATADLATQSLHVQAVESLQAINLPDHGALVSLRQQVNRRILALRSEIERCNRHHDEALANARELLAGCDYEQAAIILEAVPDPYRTEEFRHLLNEVHGRRSEVLMLWAEIRRAAAENKTDHLLPKVEKLLGLIPQHKQARALADRLRPLAQKRMVADRNTFLKSAKARLANGDFSGTLELLGEIPDAVRTPQLARLIETTQANADEVSWIERDLVQAVVHDRHLLSIAERLLNLQPTNAEALAYIDRARSSKHNRPKQPETSVWGPPLEAICSFQRIDTTALQNTAFQAAPERFCVAAGLALQGLRQSTLNINLTAPEKTRVLGLLKSRKKPSSSVWGVDAGRAAIRAIRLTLQDNGNIVADDAICVEHARVLNAPDVDSHATIDRSLDKFCRHPALRNAPLSVSVPADKTLYRPISLPRVDEKKLAGVMKFEIARQIPIPTEQLACGYQVLGARHTGLPHAGQRNVAVLALKLEEAQTAIAPFTERGLKVELLTSDAAGLFNFVVHESQHARTSAALAGDRADDNSALRVPKCEAVTAILDVGTDSSNLLLSCEGALAIRSIPFGGNTISRAIAKEFNLAFEQAEKLKRNPTAVRELHRLFGVVEPRFADLTRELRRTIDGFLQSHEGGLTRFLVAGGTLKLHSALRYLWHGV